MAIYLSLGSNLGDRRQNLERALTELMGRGVSIARVSPVVESPALLPPDALADWNRPFLNLAAECHSSLSPSALLGTIKTIERELGRDDPRHWAPRPIDIDILIYDDAVIDTAELRIPHASLAERAFVLTPLVALAPGLKLPKHGKTTLQLDRALNRRIPLWMGIINLTPDSFSDGGQFTNWDKVESQIDLMRSAGVHMLDFGAESTRPGAVALTPEDEWRRLEPMLAQTKEKFTGQWLRPLLSVDTYHADVARQALDYGVDIINDVSGLEDSAMLEVAASSSCDLVAMHNLGLPADRNRTLDPQSSATEQVEAWLDRQLENWQSNGIDLSRVIFDPGIGFGKTPLQSLELLRDVDRFAAAGLRILIGHSRKSFMQGFAGDSNYTRDLATVGTSLALLDRCVDILRVHDVGMHAQAYRGWAHAQNA